LPFNFKAAKMPIMQCLLALAIGALVGDSLLHILPAIFGVHSHAAPADHDEHAHEEEAVHDPNAERLEAMQTYLGPALLICLTILVLFLVEKLIAHLAGGRGHGHSHGGEEEPEEVEDDHSHHSHDSHKKKSNNSDPQKAAELGKVKDTKKMKAAASASSSASSSSSKSASTEGASAKESSTTKSISVSHSADDSSHSNKEVADSVAASEEKGFDSEVDSSNRRVIDLEADSISDGKPKVKPLGWFFIVADLLHNFVDGMLLGFAFAAGAQNGLVAAIAVLLHEIPKELGTFAILIQAGFSRKKALFVNLGASGTLFLGTLVGLSVGTVEESSIRWVLSIVVGAFLYLAVGDIMPQLHAVPRTPLIVSLQVIGMLVGFVVLLLIALFESHEAPTCRFA
jgi:zinc transporter ZupT